MKFVVGTKAQLKALCMLINGCLDYPRRGVHIGGGIHVDMPATWDGLGTDCAPGWTAYGDWTVIKHPTLDQYALLIDDRLRDPDLRDALLAKLTPTQQQKLKDAITTAADLAADWGLTI